MHVLLDTSGSMHGSAIELACNACFALAASLSFIPGVSVAVTAFPGDPIPASSGLDARDTVAPVLSFDGTMHNRFVMNASGSTPLAPALWWMLVQMQTVPQERKIILLITDGEPDSKVAAKTALQALHSQNIEVYGIGINIGSIRTLLPKTSVAINDIQSLPNAIFSLLQKALLNQAA